MGSPKKHKTDGKGSGKKTSGRSSSAPKAPDPHRSAKAATRKVGAHKVVAPKGSASKGTALKGTASKVVAPQSPGKASGSKPGKVKASSRPSTSPADVGTVEAVARAASAPPTWPKGGPTKADVKRHRARLLEMRAALVASTRELATEALKSSGQDFSVDHMADHGSDNYEQDFSLQLLEGEAEQLRDIRDALAKMDGAGDLPFGLCEACADDEERLCETCPWIPSSRLDVLPHARLCVQTKEIEERKKA